MATETRRNAVDFFDNVEENMETNNESVSDKVVRLLNEASLFPKDTQRVTNLKQVQELIINKEPDLLDNFLDEVLSFQHDKSADVKKALLSFIEEACKLDKEMLPKVVTNLNIMFTDENVSVQKKVIQVHTQLYKIALRWISAAREKDDLMEQTWDMMNKLKDDILLHLESENDGLRTYAVKFVEMLVLVNTRVALDSEIPKTLLGDISLDLIIKDHPILRIRKLEEEGKNAFNLLKGFMAHPATSSVNLMACMGTLTSIAKQRPDFMNEVVQCFESLHTNLPPTLTKSQVSSVRKKLKMELLNLLKHPASTLYHPQMTTLLSDLGATTAEVSKVMPKELPVKRKGPEEDDIIMNITNKKKQKLEQKILDDLGGETPMPAPAAPKPVKVEKSAIDLTQEDLVPRLTVANVSDLVLLSMTMLPDMMPAHFGSTYTPIAAAGTEAQIKHLARLLATQLVHAGYGLGQPAEPQKPLAKVEEEDDDDGGTSPKQVIQTVVGGFIDKPEDKKPFLLPVAPPKKSKKMITQFRLQDVTSELSEKQQKQMSLDAIKRIMYAEKNAVTGGAAISRVKVLTSLVTQLGGDFRKGLLAFIFDDVRQRTDLMFAWLYKEYADYQGFTSPVEEDKGDLDKYNFCLTSILNALLSKFEHKDSLFCKVLLEAPLITEEAIDILRDYCQNENHAFSGMSVLKDLIFMRPGKQIYYLNVLLEFTICDKAEVRNQAIIVTKKLYSQDKMMEEKVDTFANQILKYLEHPAPPLSLVKTDVDSWSEEEIKRCLQLYLSLLPEKHQLIHELSVVYTSASADIKRVILRTLEAPVKGMGMDSPELLLLVENCPKGAETLVTRIIHILTDKTPPSRALVERVRDLYHKRVSDIRFLIPVLIGLSKKEVVSALPKLIRLNPNVVKEVFNRLLGVNVEGRQEYTSPLTPAELLIALHLIDPAKCDMKCIIKATGMCFAESSVYTQEVLALVLQQLMEHKPLPVLFMRTVIQSLAMYPRLIGFVMSILGQLISMEVWRIKKVWVGFVKCCEQTMPQSFQVLIRLPPEQFLDVFKICPQLRDSLRRHINGFTVTQKKHIPKFMLDAIQNEPEVVVVSGTEENKPPNTENRKIIAEKPGKAEVTEHTEGDADKTVDDNQKEPETPVRISIKIPSSIQKEEPPAPSSEPTLEDVVETEQEEKSSEKPLSTVSGKNPPRRSSRVK